MLETQTLEGHRDRDSDITIIVNGREKKVTKSELSFTDVVILAFGSVPTDPNEIVTITWKRGGDRGSLVAGQTVEIKNGMIFDVTKTNRS